jgi:hypothetical protein
MSAKITIKQILLSKQNWWNFYIKNHNKVRPSIVTNIVKLLSCRNVIRGHHEYMCSNKNCSHTKRIPHTCKSKACSSCGKKATETWIEKQNLLLPDTSWQHITFTMPSELWDFFWFNRKLLNRIGLIASNSIKTISEKKKVIPGIFIAIHTFGRDLKRNVHVHLSATTGGLSKDFTQWKNLFFNQSTLMRIWRYQIISLFRETHKRQQLVIPPSVRKKLNPSFTFNDFLNILYKKVWIVHCSKPSSDHKQNVAYLARYIKRPPIAESKLRHYDGFEIAFKYRDHRTKTYRRLKLTTEQFIGRFIQHIPDIGFRMIRYYGFLAHRIRGNLLPIVYELLGQKNIQVPLAPSYAELMQKNFNFNPLSCILCGQQLALSAIRFGKYNAMKLLDFHRPLALSKNC